MVTVVANTIECSNFGSDCINECNYSVVMDGCLLHHYDDFNMISPAVFQHSNL